MDSHIASHTRLFHQGYWKEFEHVEVAQEVRAARDRVLDFNLPQGQL